MLKGRSKEQKRELVKELTSAFNKACGSNHVGIDVSTAVLPDLSGRPHYITNGYKPIRELI